MSATSESLSRRSSDASAAAARSVSGSAPAVLSSPTASHIVAANAAPETFLR